VDHPCVQSLGSANGRPQRPLHFLWLAHKALFCTAEETMIQNPSTSLSDAKRVDCAIPIHQPVTLQLLDLHQGFHLVGMRLAQVGTIVDNPHLVFTLQSLQTAFLKLRY
jgi:hypothetical protein